MRWSTSCNAMGLTFNTVDNTTPFSLHAPLHRSPHRSALESQWPQWGNAPVVCILRKSRIYLRVHPTRDLHFRNTQLVKHPWGCNFKLVSCKRLTSPHPHTRNPTPSRVVHSHCTVRCASHARSTRALRPARHMIARLSPLQLRPAPDRGAHPDVSPIMSHPHPRPTPRSRFTPP